MSEIKYLYRIIFVLAVLSISGCDVASSQQDFVSLVTSLQSQFPAMLKLISACAYILGLWLVVKGIYAFKLYGEEKTRNSVPHSLKPALIYFLVGTALVYSPTTINIVMQTTFGDSNILAYAGSGKSFGGIQFTTALLALVQVVGFISFIRGWAMMAQLAHGASQERSFGKAMTHIIGGIFSMNIQATIAIFSATFGVGG